MSKTSAKPWAYMARHSRGKTSSATPPAQRPSDTPDHHADTASRKSVGRERLLMIIGVSAVALPILRLSGVIHWAWGWVLTPFTVIGAATTIGVGVFVFRGRLMAAGMRLLGRRAAT